MTTTRPELNVRWVGILWGDDSSVTYHSPSWNVRADLPDFDY